MVWISCTVHYNYTLYRTFSFSQIHLAYKRRWKFVSKLVPWHSVCKPSCHHARLRTVDDYLSSEVDIILWYTQNLIQLLWCQCHLLLIAITALSLYSLNGMTMHYSAYSKVVFHCSYYKNRPTFKCCRNGTFYLDTSPMGCMESWLASPHQQ